MEVKKIKLPKISYFQELKFNEELIFESRKREIWVCVLNILRREYLNNLLELEDEIMKRIIYTFKDLFAYSLPKIQKTYKNKTNGKPLSLEMEAILSTANEYGIDWDIFMDVKIEKHLRYKKLILIIDQISMGGTTHIIESLDKTMVCNSLDDMFKNSYAETSQIKSILYFLTFLRKLRNLLAHQAIWPSLDDYFNQVYFDKELLNHSQIDNLFLLKEQLSFFNDESFCMRLIYSFKDDKILQNLINGYDDVYEDIIHNILDNINIKSI